MTHKDTDMKDYFKPLSSCRSMLSDRISWDLAISVSISVFIHIFIAVMLWNNIVQHITAESKSTDEDKSLILTLDTFTHSSHDIEETEVSTQPVLQRTESSEHLPESAQEEFGAMELKTQADTEDKIIQEPESPPIEVSDIDEIPEADPQTAYNIARDFGKSPKLETDTVIKIKSQEFQVEEPIELESAEVIAVPVFETSYDFKIIPEQESDTIIKFKGIGDINSLYSRCYFRTDHFAPSFGTDTYFKLEKLIGKIPDSELRKMRYIAGRHTVEDYKKEYKKYKNCKTAYSGAGLLAVPLLLRDAVTGNKCKWIPIIE